MPDKKPLPVYFFILFLLRLFCYLSVAFLILLHPGITVSYDRTGFYQWFLIIPIEALIAFLPAPKGKFRYKLLTALIPLCILPLLAAGASASALPLFTAGFLSFTLTLLLFHYPRWGKVSIGEPFFLAWVCLRLLLFSRSGEDASGISSGLTQFILIFTIIVFLFYSAIIYFCLYPYRRNNIVSGKYTGEKKELFLFVFAATAAIMAVIIFLPPNFIRNPFIINLLQGKIDRRIKPDDNDWSIPDDGGGRRNSRNTVPRNGDGRFPSLKGLSEHEWPGTDDSGGQGSRRRNNNGYGDGEGEGDGSGVEEQQYAVMVLVSKNEPVYLGNSIRGRFDPVQGFLYSPDEELNRLPAQRFFVTWFDNEPGFDMGRSKWETFSLSTLSQKYLPYRPFAIEPTVLSENSGPFRYIHHIVSNVHDNDPFNLLFTPIRDFSAFEKAELAPYLTLPLSEDDREVFAAHLNGVIQSWKNNRDSIMKDTHNEYMEKIIAILLGFSEFKYHVNKNNYAPVSAMVNFLQNTRNGDCVEFSNTAALLGRLAGIPSRVVTGYLASEGLQTIAHLRGLAALRSRIPFLQQFPLNDMFLVTTAHGHSWPQFFIPDYGWVDFESTYFAIPPSGMGDGNLRDVVIPLLDENQVFKPVRSFPWKAVLRVLSALAILALLGAYALRYGRELALLLGSRRGGHAGARPLYLLLLARLAADGRPIKPASKTASEYSKLFPGAERDGPFAVFAQIYSELRWRIISDRAEEEKLFESLKTEYGKILSSLKRRGVKAFVIRIFSLRALAYL